MADDPVSSFTTMLKPAHLGMNFTKTIHRNPGTSIDPAKVTLPDGYTVVITGAGKGIGEYIAKAYAKAKVRNFVLTSRTKSDLERVKGELEAIAKKDNGELNVALCPGDATKLDSYRAIEEVLRTRFGGRLDCLVNNAGGGDMAEVRGPLHEANLDLFTNMTALNYMAPHYGTMTLMPFLLDSASSGRTVINIVSGAAHMINVSPPSYNVSKLATTRMTEVIASAYAKQGLSCFALHPGAAPTPGALEQLPGHTDFLTDDVSLCGAVCVWLSKEEPTWASGRYISSTWDMDEFKAMKQEIVDGDKLKFRMVV